MPVSDNSSVSAGGGVEPSANPEPENARLVRVARRREELSRCDVCFVTFTASESCISSSASSSKIILALFGRGALLLEVEIAAVALDELCGGNIGDGCTAGFFTRTRSEALSSEPPTNKDDFCVSVVRKRLTSADTSLPKVSANIFS